MAPPTCLCGPCFPKAPRSAGWGDEARKASVSLSLGTVLSHDGWWGWGGVLPSSWLLERPCSSLAA